MLVSTPAWALLEIEREQLRALPDWFPYVSCQEGKGLKQCFVWTRDECEAMTAQVMQSCLNMYDTQFRRADTGSLEEWRERIIACTVNDIRAKLRTRKVDSMMCRNKGMY